MRVHNAVDGADTTVLGSMSLRIVATVISLVVAVSGLSAPVNAQSGGNAVTDWNLIAVNTLMQFPGPAGGAPPAIQVHMGMVQGAVYDALNAIGPRHRRPYLLESRFASTASKEARAATAAYHVLSMSSRRCRRPNRSRTGQTWCRCWTRSMKPRSRQYPTGCPRTRASRRGTRLPTLDRRTGERRPLRPNTMEIER